MIEFRHTVAVLALVAAASVARAETVRVTIDGQVVFNGVSGPPLEGVGNGEAAVMTFLVDTDDFLDAEDNRRGYVIDHATFSLSFEGGVSVELLDPFPDGQTPYFTVVDGFPVSDGFWVSISPFSPGGVPLEQTPNNANLELGYVGETLDSRDILDALGVYGFGGLTRFGFNLWQIVPDNVRMELDFEQLTIELVEADCPADLDGSGAVDFADILAVLAAWGNKGGPEDLDEDGFVGFGDLLIVLSSWGPCA